MSNTREPQANPLAAALREAAKAGALEALEAINYGVAPEPVYKTLHELAEMCGVSISTVRRWRDREGMPVRKGHRVELFEFEDWDRFRSSTRR